MRKMHKIKAHPVIAAAIVLWGDDLNFANVLHKGKDCEGSVIYFDKRQVWKVYPYKRYSNDTEYCGACEYKNVYIRLMPRDFKRIFGEDIIERAERGGEE